MISEFENGYLCAVSALLVNHGEESYAKELLGALGRVKWKDVEEYDREVFKKYHLRKCFR